MVLLMRGAVHLRKKTAMTIIKLEFKSITWLYVFIILLAVAALDYMAG